MDRVLHREIDVPVEAPVGHVVNDKAEGRLVQGFPGIQLHGQEIVLPDLEVGKQDGEGRIAVSVDEKFLPVQIDRGLMGRPLESDVDVLPGEGFLTENNPLVARHLLIDVLVEIVKRGDGRAVGQAHLLPACHGMKDHVRRKLPGIGPVPVDVDSFPHRSPL